MIVGFGLWDGYPEANARHYAFLLRGLQEVETELSRRRIKLVVLRGEPYEAALDLARDAAVVVCDRGYLRHQKTWRRRVAREAGKKVVQVEGDVVVRRELAVNFVHYTDDYDSYRCLPEWARKTLDEHRDDQREHVYTRGELEAAETHDRYWNAAMREMVHTGCGWRTRSGRRARTSATGPPWIPCRPPSPGISSASSSC